MNKSYILATALSFVSLSSYGASTQVNLFNAFVNVVFDNTGTVALTAGASGDGDGAIMQLGYYTGVGADTSTHTGTWTSLTGSGSSNPSIDTTIGDGSVVDGLYSSSVTLNDATDVVVGSGTQLAIRFYNGTTLDASTHYNTVTQADWTLGAFGTPAPTPKTFSTFDAGLVWEDAAGSFATSIEIVPEPSSTALLGLGGLALFLRRRR